ncbi:hypothetical protein QVD17_17234 [Tagetes erecta]|uniref:RRM domain-containing protein n=1 Tax=Tagetes erecta TaxID=13708 RepID=A0AAD8P188_TARER|nr:hypothetical protein QVD17_17234 [Tagetes erecta]
MSGGHRNAAAPGWQDVPYRRGKKKEYKEKPNVTSFYISNLEADCNPKELALIFDKFGRVVDTYIAGRKDREGSYFGFVRFQNVINKLELEEQLQGVKMNNVILSVNLAKHGKSVYPKASHIPIYSNRPTPVFSAAPTRTGTSYADAVKPTLPPQNLENIIRLEDGESIASRHWAVSSVVGRALDIQKLCSLSKFFSELPLTPPIIKYIGGFFVLISFANQHDSESFLNDAGVWKSQFSKVEAWKGQSLPYERIAFVNIHGVPISLWDKHTFDTIAGRCGRIIYPSNAGLYDGNLSAESMAILVNSAQKVSMEISIMWNKKTFKCWIIEEESKWVPDFLGKSSAGFFSNNNQFSCSGEESPAIPATESCAKSGEQTRSSGNVCINDNIIMEAASSSPCSLEEGEINVSASPEIMDEDVNIEFNSLRNSNPCVNFETKGPISPLPLHEPILRKEHLSNGPSGLSLAPEGSSQKVSNGPIASSRKRPRTHNSLLSDFSMDLDRVFGPTLFNTGSSSLGVSLHSHAVSPFQFLFPVAPVDSTRDPVNDFTVNNGASHLQSQVSSDLDPPLSNRIVCRDDPGHIEAASDPRVEGDPPTIETCSSDPTITNISPEVLATLAMAKDLGIDMSNHVNLVTEVIEGEEENAVAQ